MLSNDIWGVKGSKSSSPQVTVCYFFFAPLVEKPHTGRVHVFLKSVLTEELHLGIVHMGNTWNIIKAWDNNLHGVQMFLSVWRDVM